MQSAANQTKTKKNDMKTTTQEPEIKTSIRVEFSAPHFDPYSEQVKFSAHVIGTKGSAAFDYSGGILAFSTPADRDRLMKRYKRIRTDNRADILAKILSRNVKASQNVDRPHVMRVFRDLASLSKPKATDLIACLILNANGTDQTFEQWAADLGYDSDSRKAEAIFNAFKDTARKLAAILSPEQRTEAEQIAANY